MAHYKATYLGDLRTNVTHIKSGTQIITDAPTDNHGKGEAFSPTDLASASLGSCMATIMGIFANKHEITLPKFHYETEKIMASNPRRIDSIKIHFTFEENTLSDEEKLKLERAAKTCPVALSLHPDIKQEVSFDFN
ncbi:MAG: osmotically inducible protein OsmC [Thalassobius sp.]|nr:osmotically inducible protein OsmC [Thalassovita sp.]